MSALLALGGLALWGIIATIECVSRDGYRQVPVRSHAEQLHGVPQSN